MYGCRLICTQVKPHKCLKVVLTGRALFLFSKHGLLSNHEPYVRPCCWVFIKQNVCKHWFTNYVPSMMVLYVSGRPASMHGQGHNLQSSVKQSMQTGCSIIPLLNISLPFYCSYSIQAPSKTKYLCANIPLLILTSKRNLDGRYRLNLIGRTSSFYLRTISGSMLAMVYWLVERIMNTHFSATCFSVHIFSITSIHLCARQIKTYRRIF